MSEASAYRDLPGMDKIISDSRIAALINRYAREQVINMARQKLEKAREDVSRGKPAATLEKIVESIITEAGVLYAPGLKPVINATGVILHTNLGRAPLSKETVGAMSGASAGYSNLEFDLDKGDRGSRHTHVENILCRVTGAEAGIVVNNNAAAVLLILTCLAKRREVIVSRGELVEIGGGFRVPDVMKESGAKLVEVGTTNKTYIEDYAEAINEKTAALMRVHPSNFKVQGFTHGVAIDEISGLGKQRNVLVIDDLGSGCLLETSKYGLSPEPTVQQSIASGVTLACFSGDKLLGGPQAGIIVGRREYVAKLKKHPLARALRMDKSRLAGLWATLMHYAAGEAEQKVPVWRMISLSLAEIGSRTDKWAQVLAGKATVVDGYSMIGGGSLPGEILPTRLLALNAVKDGKGKSRASLLSDKLRANDPPVIARIENDVLLLDPRTVQPGEDEAVAEALLKLTGLIQ
jgi:L-seryl-tRNA(Ser) seleniumtransferase